MRSSDRQCEQQWDYVKQDFNVTILCCHTFNWRCLIRGGGQESQMVESDDQVQTCPLCRYYQNPRELSHCDDCGITDNQLEQIILKRSN